MPLTEQDLTDLEIADSVGDFGRHSKVSDAVEELRAARARVAELETVDEAGARAVDALERIGEQARQRIVELTAGLREACDAADTVGPRHDKLARLRKLADRATTETPASSLAERYRAFTALRDELIAAGVCLACGAVRPGRTCQCENDE